MEYNNIVKMEFTFMLFFINYIFFSPDEVYKRQVVCDIRKTKFGTFVLEA